MDIYLFVVSIVVIVVYMFLWNDTQFGMYYIPTHTQTKPPHPQNRISSLCTDTCTHRNQKTTR